MDESGRVAEQIISGVAAKEGVSETELPPLYEYVDVDALESLLAHAGRSSMGAVTIELRYLEYTVTVSETGVVSIED